MKILIIETSLSPNSRSSKMAEIAFQDLKGRKVDVELVNIVDLNLPLCDAKTCFENPNVQALSKKVKAADGVIIALPIHNYNVAASAKNIAEVLTVDAWGEKTLGFIVASGGDYSYLAVMTLATSFMMDYRCMIIPRFVFASFKDFDQDKPVAETTIAQIKRLSGDIIRYTQALMPLRNK